MFLMLENREPTTVTFYYDRVRSQLRLILAEVIVVASKRIILKNVVF